MFSNGYDRQQFLDEQEQVDSELWRSHIAAFIQSFVIQIKRDRWRHLCLEKPEKAQRESARMYTDLKREICLRTNCQDVISLEKRQDKGIYYDFQSKAYWLSAADAFHAGHGYESIFSIREGEFCVYFWHEMEEYLCQKTKDESGFKIR